METTQRNATAAHTVVLALDKDMYFTVSEGVLRPLARKAALAAIAHTTVMLQSGNIVRFAVAGVVQS